MTASEEEAVAVVGQDVGFFWPAEAVARISERVPGPGGAPHSGQIRDWGPSGLLSRIEPAWRIIATSKVRKDDFCPHLHASVCVCVCVCVREKVGGRGVVGVHTCEGRDPHGWAEARPRRSRGLSL